MNIIIETRSIENATRLRTDILTEIRNENIDTWHYEKICIGEVHYDSIYHYNEQIRNSENKIVHLRFEVLGSTIKVRESWPTGHEPDEDVKHWLWGTLYRNVDDEFPESFL